MRAEERAGEVVLGDASVFAVRDEQTAVRAVERDSVRHRKRLRSRRLVSAAAAAAEFRDERAVRVEPRDSVAAVPVRHPERPVLRDLHVRGRAEPRLTAVVVPLSPPLSEPRHFLSRRRVVLRHRVRPDVRDPHVPVRRQRDPVRHVVLPRAERRDDVAGDRAHADDDVLLDRRRPGRHRILIVDEGRGVPDPRRAVKHPHVPPVRLHRDAAHLPNLSRPRLSSRRRRDDVSAQLGRVRRDAAAAAAAAAAPRVLEDDVGVELKGVSRS
eukprot:31178-Pelagococcus_subviridis.AAC.20